MTPEYERDRADMDEFWDEVRNSIREQFWVEFDKRIAREVPVVIIKEDLEEAFTVGLASGVNEARDEDPWADVEAAATECGYQARFDDEGNG